MYPEADQFEIEPIEIPKVRRSPWALVKMIAALTLLGGAAWAWHAGYRPANLFGRTVSPIHFVEIDSGDVDIVVVENGTIESASNATVRCQVEALIGLVGGNRCHDRERDVGPREARPARAAPPGVDRARKVRRPGQAARPRTGTSGSTTKAKTSTKAGSSSTSKTGTTGSSSSTSSSGSSGSSTSSSSGSSVHQWAQVPPRVGQAERPPRPPSR